MKSHEQALLLLKKAAQDEALLGEVLPSDRVDDEIVGFHCQQAAEKLLKALLSELQVRFGRTHNLRQLMDLLAESGHPLPAELQGLDALTPYGTLFRYEDVPSPMPLDRRSAREELRSLRAWVSSRIGTSVGP